MQALDDTKIISLAQIYNGPYCALMLQFLGGEVIKVEPPGGEQLRSNDADEAPAFIMLNSSKKSVTLNLKSDRGKELFKELVQDADVLVENYRVGTMDRLGLGYETLREINPGLIYAHGSGYGESGPYTDYPAMDFTIQAMSGIMDVTGYSDQPPVMAGVQLCDFFGGIHLAAGVLAALHQRDRTGEGQFVEVGMFDAIYPNLTSQMAAYYTTPELPHRTGNHHSRRKRCPYNVYETSDGYIAIFCVTERHWERFTTVMGNEELHENPALDSHEKRSDRMEELDEIIESWTQEHERDVLAQTFLDAGVPCAPVQERDEVLYDPHLESRDMVNEINHPEFGDIRVPGMPIRPHESEYPDIEPAPGTGEHNEEVLSELGLSADEIGELYGDEII